jgi:60 kDa SS-A/Ro ribonucleoprotein
MLSLVVVGLTATNFSIADPNDSGMLDVVGFDASAPNVIADFAREDS